MAGIYVHFPFCKQKCIYCNFYSVASQKDKAAYWDALCQEIVGTTDFLPTNNIDTLYFGGGTPSLCSPAELERIIKEIQKYYFFNGNFEFTMEANPEQLTPEYLQDIKSLGINRLSIGVQSFDDEILRLLNRRHTAEEAVRAVENAAEAGFSNLSIDLIYDIAYRTKAMWERDLQKAFSLPISHLSAYSLTVEENTILARQIANGKEFVPDECDTERDYALLIEQTEKAGFAQYEISNFAKGGMVSRHNSAYWNRTPYLGLGVSAHSFCGNIRRWNVANLRQYIDGMLRGEPVREKETLSSDDQYNEYVLLQLRTNAGLDLDELTRLFGTDYKNLFIKQLENIKTNYYLKKDNRVQLSYTGRLFADAVAMELFV